MTKAMGNLRLYVTGQAKFWRLLRFHCILICLCCSVFEKIVEMYNGISGNISVIRSPLYSCESPSSTRLPTAMWWWHTRPTQQSSVTPAKERAPMTDSASGGRG